MQESICFRLIPKKFGSKKDQNYDKLISYDIEHSQKVKLLKDPVIIYDGQIDYRTSLIGDFFRKIKAKLLCRKSKDNETLSLIIRLLINRILNCGKNKDKGWQLQFYF